MTISRRFGLLSVTAMFLCCASACGDDAGSSAGGTGGTAGSAGAAGGVAGTAGASGGAAGAAGTAGTAGASGAGGTSGAAGSAGSGPCAYTTVLNMPGPVFTPTDAKPEWVSKNLTGGKTFRCLRATYTVEAPNNTDALVAKYGGCPVFLHAGGLESPEGEVLVSYFRFRKANGCAYRTGAFSCLCLSGNNSPNQSINGVAPGETYKIVQEIQNLNGLTTQFFDTSGKLVKAISLTGPTAKSATKDATFRFGLDKIKTQAFFPYFDAKLSDLTVEMDLDP